MHRTRMAIQLKQSRDVYDCEGNSIICFSYIAPIIYLRQFCRPRKECCFSLSLSLSADYNKMGNTRWRLSRSIESLVMWTLLWKWNTARCSGRRRRRHRLLVYTPKRLVFLDELGNGDCDVCFFNYFLFFASLFLFFFFICEFEGGKSTRRYLFCWFTAI